MVFPLVAIAAVLCGTKTLITITLASLTNYVEARKKLKSVPSGPPRPPRGMTRAELIREAREKLGMDVVNHFNFVVCGGSGAGKFKKHY